MGILPPTTTVSTLFQYGLAAEARSPEAQDPRGGPGVPLPAAHIGLPPALAVGPSGRHAEPRQRGLAQPLPRRCVSTTHGRRWREQKGSLSPRFAGAEGALSLPPSISFHTSLSFYVINFNCGNRTHIRKVHIGHTNCFTIHVKKQDIPNASKVTDPSQHNPLPCR